MIIINKSLGELDWLIFNWPYLDLRHPINILCYRVSKQKVINHAPNFFRENNQIRLLDFGEVFKFASFFQFFDNLMDRLSTKVFNTFGPVSQSYIEIFFGIFRNCLAYRNNLSSSLCGDFVYHEYNARGTFLLSLLPRGIVVNFFPHHFGPSPMLSKIERRVMNIVSKTADYKLLHTFERPSATSVKNLKRKKTDSHVVLILTRQCSPIYGFSYKEAFDVLNKLCEVLRRSDVEIYIKHHPREHEYYFWEILEDFYKIKRIDGSIFDFVSDLNVVCFHLFTTLVWPLSELGVKCFDVSPYNLEILDEDNIVKVVLDFQLRNLVSIRVHLEDIESIAEDLFK